MDIKILNKNFVFQGAVDDFKTLSLERKYNDIDVITITIEKQKENTSYLVKGNYVFLDDRFDKFFRIYNRKEVADSKGTIVTITGYSVERLLKQRITIPPTGYAADTKTGSIEYIIKEYITANCISSTTPNFNYSWLELAANKNLGLTLTDETRYKNLYEEVVRLSTLSDLGTKSQFDYTNKKIIFDVFKGVDRSVDNTAGNNPVIFSIPFDNLLKSEIEQNYTTVKNYAVVGGQGEGELREIVSVVGETCDSEDIEAFFVDARDLEDAALLPNRGKGEMVLPQAYINATINPYSNQKYEEDYDVGDLVTVVIDDMVFNTRIIEATESYNGNNGLQLDLTFGNKTFDLLTIINSQNNRVAKLETK